MKKIFYVLMALIISADICAQVPDPCGGAGAIEPVSTLSPCNCGEAQSGTPCNKSVFASQTAADNAIHTFLSSPQIGYALPTTPTAWQDLRSSNMNLDGFGIIKHEVSMEITTGPSTNVIDVFNIVQVRNLCTIACQNYKIIPKLSGTCGNNALTPTLVTSLMDPTVQYRQYAVSPNTSYIISRQMYFDGNNINCYIPWTGTDGISATGAKITAQHWFVFTSFVLPVKLTSFTGVAFSNANYLHWTAENETNFSRYEIQRSEDGTQFETIGTVAAIEGPLTKEYSYTDQSINNKLNLFYRLKQVDKDGQFTYSKIISITVKQHSNSFIVFPNPAFDKTEVKITAETTSNGRLEIVSINGGIIQNKSIVLQKGLNSFTIDVSALPKGIYQIRSVTAGEVLTQKLIKL